MFLMVDWEVVCEEIVGVCIFVFIFGEVWFGNNSGVKKLLDKDDVYLGKVIVIGNVDLWVLYIV